MSLFLRLLIAFTAVPILELFLLVELGTVIGVAPTILLVVLTGLLGAYLTRREGLGVLRRIQKDLHEGRPPTDSLLNGAVILISGALLLTPGLVTDLIGFLGLIPTSRSMLVKHGWKYVRGIWHDNKDQSDRCVDVNFDSGSGREEGNDADDQD